MGLFGWSLPPGCGTLPGEEPVPPCEVCGRDPEGSSLEGGCICPECDCGEVGNPKCYEEHGLIRTPEQTQSRQQMDDLIEDDIQADKAYFEMIEKESSEHEF